MSALQGIVQYRRKDGGHGWLAMAAYDTEHMARRYAFKCSRDDSENWPWEYRALDLAGAVLPPLDVEEQERLTKSHRLNDAAPDLLEALKELVEAEKDITDYENGDIEDDRENFDPRAIYPRMEAAREAARAAIAKASPTDGAPPPPERSGT